MGSLESTQEVRVLLFAASRDTLTTLSCSTNFLCLSITQYTHDKHENILYLIMFDSQTFYLWTGLSAICEPLARS